MKHCYIHHCARLITESTSRKWMILWRAGFASIHLNFTSLSLCECAFCSCSYSSITIISLLPFLHCLDATDVCLHPHPPPTPERHRLSPHTFWRAACPLHHRLEAGAGAPGWERNALNWNICQAADYMIAASPTRSGGCLKNQKHSLSLTSAAEEPWWSNVGDRMMKRGHFPPSLLQKWW